jgi:pyruvate dehydrogenase E2 component (dihydrolipoyllysine-residue acetyltransferase)
MSGRLEEFRMPLLGADMEAGTLVEWHKAPGDRLARGDIIAEVETDKGAIEIEVFTPGTLSKILVEPGRKVPVGTPLALIAPDETAVPEHLQPPLGPSGAAVAPAAAPAAAALAGGRQRASPLARRVAAELGVELAAVKGTGPEGAVTREDVEAAARVKGAPAEIAAKGEDRAAGMRRAIAAAMSRSKRDIPHYYLSTTIDFGRATDWLAEQNRDRAPVDRLLPAMLQIKAVALALRDFPDLNAWWVGDAAVPKASIHVGIAISLRGGGLVAPAVHDTDRLSPDALMRAMRDLVGRVRGGALRSSELADSTITVSNLGDRGVDALFGVIYPPQVALVGFGRIARRPWVVGDRLLARPVVVASLSADHRASDGHRGGLFLARVEQLVQEPEHL